MKHATSEYPIKLALIVRERESFEHCNLCAWRARLYVIVKFEALIAHREMPRWSLGTSVSSYRDEIRISPLTDWAHPVEQVGKLRGSVDGSLEHESRWSVLNETEIPNLATEASAVCFPRWSLERLCSRYNFARCLAELVCSNGMECNARNSYPPPSQGTNSPGKHPESDEAIQRAISISEGMKVSSLISW